MEIEKKLLLVALLLVTLDYDHCLHQLLPDTRNSHGRYMRTRGHQYTLPLVNTSLHKASFMVKCLYDFL